MKTVPTPKESPLSVTRLTDSVTEGVCVGAQGSAMQSDGQLSVLTVLPSSHVSAPSVMLFPQTEEPAVLDVVLLVEVLEVVGVGALDELVELVDVVLGDTPVDEVVEAMLVDVVLGSDPFVDDVVLVVLVEVAPPIVEDVLDDVLVEVEPAIVVDVLVVVGVPMVVVVVPPPSFTVTCPVRMERATPRPSSVDPCMSQRSPFGTQMVPTRSARRWKRASPAETKNAMSAASSPDPAAGPVEEPRPKLTSFTIATVAGPRARMRARGPRWTLQKT